MAKKSSTDPRPMSSREFNQAIKQGLGLSIYAGAPTIGIGLRQAYRYSSGEDPVPAPIAKLLRLALRHKIPVAELLND